jgi:hypothetical protein
LSDQLPEPLVPAEVDLRDFAFMPLDVVRLRDSDLAALESPDACWAAVLLWCASWHQVPAASVPDDDRVLANLAGFGRVVREWQKIRDGALRGWILCSDGRLYHPVVAAKAMDAWRSKLEQRWRTEAGRVKKHNQRNQLIGTPDEVHMPDVDRWIALGCPQGHALHVPGDNGDVSPGTTPSRPQFVPRETPSKGQGEGQGQGQGLEKKEEPTVLVDTASPSPPADLLGDAVSGPYKPPPSPNAEIVDLYRRALPQLPGVEVLNDSRKRAIAARWREVCSDGRLDKAQGLEWFAWYFGHVAKSRFLTGQTPGRSGRTWVADFDFLMTASKFAKVVEGSYHKDSA